MFVLELCSRLNKALEQSSCVDIVEEVLQPLAYLDLCAHPDLELLSYVGPCPVLCEMSCLESGEWSENDCPTYDNENWMQQNEVALIGGLRWRFLQPIKQSLNVSANMNTSPSTSTRTAFDDMTSSYINTSSNTASVSNRSTTPSITSSITFFDTFDTTTSTKIVQNSILMELMSTKNVSLIAETSSVTLLTEPLSLTPATDEGVTVSITQDIETSSVNPFTSLPTSLYDETASIFTSETHPITTNSKTPGSLNHTKARAEITPKNMNTEQATQQIYTVVTESQTSEQAVTESQTSEQAVTESQSSEQAVTESQSSVQGVTESQSSEQVLNGPKNCDRREYRSDV
ncbi:hypothetical protein KIN20_015147 [Parelaphostrongylus tenuis]|uniref:Uncharacterized protein n=1 Tax=Parelaphostrongylus tenuis TaxID=148309 RepID=A0AAD5MI45_PARTN|nr:hypothetical protein KIN20_015147 [Parelaphostrongylus tenuis]